MNSELRLEVTPVGPDWDQTLRQRFASASHTAHGHRLIKEAGARTSSFASKPGEAFRGQPKAPAPPHGQ